MKDNNFNYPRGGKLGVMTPDELFVELGIAKGTQANLRSAGKLPYCRIGKKVAYFIEDIREMLNSHRVDGTI